MKKSNLIYIFVFFLLLSSCVSKEQKEGTLNISGAFALYPLVIKWSEEYKKEFPEIRFNISAGGAGKGMTDALAGTVDLGMFSREITPAEKEKGVWWVGLCVDAVIPTICAQNPYIDSIKTRGLTKSEFKAIFIDEAITDWNQIFKIENSVKIQVYTRSDACGAAGTWAEYLNGIQEDLKGIGINGDPALAEAVSKDKNGIAFNNTNYIYDIKTGKKRPNMEVVPIDQNENGKIDPEENFYNSFNEILTAVANGKFPSPPARELYFVSNGKPTKKATLDFIQWTLTKGQKFVTEAGYVPISSEKINGYLKKINE